MRNFLGSVFLFFMASVAQAEIFKVTGGSITAVKQKNDIVVMVEGMSATRLIHFRAAPDGAGNFMHPVTLNAGKATLEDVAKNGQRFQVQDASGKWLLITPSGNPYKLVGVVQECKKSKAGCALEATVK